MKVGSTIKSQCRLCIRQTNHAVKAVEITRDSNDDYGYYSTEKFAIIQCLGCETYSFRKEYQDSESYDYNNDGEQIHALVTDAYPLVLNEHKALRGTWFLPTSIGLMYKESIAAYAADCKVLAGAGFRAIIEAVCLDKEIAGKDLEAKINNLLKKALITRTECDRLHSIRFIGNDSVHEMKEPKEEQLRLVLDIIEHILSNIYIIDEEAKSKLEGIINDYKDFKKLLFKGISNIKAGEEHYLAKIFGKDFRRVKDGYAAFEAELLKEIASGDFKKLTIGAMKAKSADPKAGIVQHFIIS